MLALSLNFTSCIITLSWQFSHVACQVWKSTFTRTPKTHLYSKIISYLITFAKMFILPSSRLRMSGGIQWLSADSRLSQMQMLPHAYWLFNKVWRSKRGPAVANANTLWKIHNAKRVRRLRVIIPWSALMHLKRNECGGNTDRTIIGKNDIWLLFEVRPVSTNPTLSISSQRCLPSSAPDLTLAWRDGEYIWTGLGMRACCERVWKGNRRSFLCLFILASWESGDDPLTAS